MHTISGNSMNELFAKLCNKLVTEGEHAKPRGLLTLELRGVTLELFDVYRPYVTFPERKLSREYIAAEYEWYESGDLNPEYIKKFAPFWGMITNPDGTVNSNYGYLAFHEKHNGLTQFEWCVKALKSDIDSRQAVICFNQPRHKVEGVKDFPCTMFAQFMVRNRMFLEMHIFMRSNDIVFGLCNDVPWFCELQKRMALVLGLPVGTYYHTAVSMHAYERHFGMVHEIAKKYIAGDDKSSMAEVEKNGRKQEKHAP